MILLRVAAYVVTAYLTAGAFLFFQQSKLLFPAPKTFPESTPADAGLRYEDLRIPVAGEGFVHAWWIPDPDVSAKTILMFHGNGYVLEDMVDTEVRELHALRANLMLIDYRGYGSSKYLKPDESTIREDADAALRYVLIERGIPAQRIFVMGRSIGSGPAVYLTSRNPGLAGLILESPFSSVDDAAHEAWYLKIYPLRFMLRTHFDNYSRIASVRVPLFIASGTADELTPPWMAQKIFASANEPKKLMLIQGAGHNDLIEVGGHELSAALQAFLSTYRAE